MEWAPAQDVLLIGDTVDQLFYEAYNLYLVDVSTDRILASFDYQTQNIDEMSPPRWSPTGSAVRFYGIETVGGFEEITKLYTLVLDGTVETHRFNYLPSYKACISPLQSVVY